MNLGGTERKKNDRLEGLKRMSAGAVVAAYGLAAVGGILGLWLALNLRNLVLFVYRAGVGDGVPWAGSLVNAVTVIILMILWVVYYFYFQHVLEKKCESLHDYRRAILRFVLPVVAMLIVTIIVERTLLM